MNIRPRAGETEQPDNCQHPPTQACFARPISCRGDARARDRLVRPCREANKEQRNASQKARYLANREEILASQAAYREANREKRLAYMVAYRAARRAARKQPQ
jgi:hypothetical protein